MHACFCLELNLGGGMYTPQNRIFFGALSLIRFYLHSCSCPRQTVLCPKIFAVLLGILALAASDPEQVHYSVCACSGECGWGRSK